MKNNIASILFQNDDIIVIGRMDGTVETIEKISPVTCNYPKVVLPINNAHRQIEINLEKYAVIVGYGESSTYSVSVRCAMFDGKWYMMSPQIREEIKV